MTRSSDAHPTAVAAALGVSLRRRSQAPAETHGAQGIRKHVGVNAPLEDGEPVLEPRLSTQVPGTLLQAEDGCLGRGVRTAGARGPCPSFPARELPGGATLCLWHLFLRLSHNQEAVLLSHQNRPLSKSPEPSLEVASLPPRLALGPSAQACKWSQGWRPPRCS